MSNKTMTENICGRAKVPKDKRIAYFVIVKFISS